MELRIFTLPFDENIEGFPDEIITQFCLNKKVHSVQTQFFLKNNNPYWSVAIQYETILKGEERIKALDEAQQLLYKRLRAWRKEKGMKVGYPVYLIATNAQLTDMILLKCRTLESLKQVKGFGKKRIEKYGKSFIQIINHFYEEKHPKKQEATTKSDHNNLPFNS